MTRASKNLTAKLLNQWNEDPKEPLHYRCKVCGLMWKMMNPAMNDIRINLSANEFKRIAKEINQYNYDNFVKIGGLNNPKAYDTLQENLNKHIYTKMPTNYAKCPRGCSIDKGLK